MYVLEIFEQGPVGRNTTQPRLPGVHVGVDEAGDGDEALRIDHLRVAGFQCWRRSRHDCGNVVIFDQDVANQLA